MHPPFLFGITPATHDGGQYFSQPGEEFSIVEMVAVYGADYDAPAAVENVERTIADCQDDRFRATAMEGDAIELTACSDHNGFDILPVAQSALKRIEALANMTA